MFKKALPLAAVVSALLVPSAHANNDMQLNQYIVDVINSKLDSSKYKLKLQDNKPVLSFPIPGKDFGGCTVNHKLKDSSYMDFRIKTPDSLNLSLDTTQRKPYLAKRFTFPLSLDGKLNMVTRTGVRVLGSCSNYSKDNWYYSMKLDNELIVDVGMFLNPRVVNTSHGKAVSITPMVKLSAHIKDFDEKNIDIKDHGQDFGWLWGILDFTNGMIKTLVTSPSNWEQEFKDNFQVGESISMASTLEGAGLLDYDTVVKLFDGFNKLNTQVHKTNKKWGDQITELEDKINGQIRVALRKYRPWAAEAGESNPNTVYIPWSRALDLLPEPKPLKAEVYVEPVGCYNRSFRSLVDYSALDATSYKVSYKYNNSWRQVYSGPNRHQTYNRTSSATYKVEGCNASGCGTATTFTVPGRRCGDNEQPF